MLSAWHKQEADRKPGLLKSWSHVPGRWSQACWCGESSHSSRRPATWQVRVTGALGILGSLMDVSSLFLAQNQGRSWVECAYKGVESWDLSLVHDPRGSHVMLQSSLIYTQSLGWGWGGISCPSESLLILGWIEWQDIWMLTEYKWADSSRNVVLFSNGFSFSLHLSAVR